MPPAARVTDMHVCPMVTVLVPHVGGPILPPGVPTVLIGFLPAATVTDMLTCVGPPDMIAMGSVGVFINYLPAARLGDPTAHGGVIVLGEPTVMIGEVGSPAPGAAGASAVTAGMAAAGGDNTNANASMYSVPGPGAGSGSGAAGSGSGGPAWTQASIKSNLDACDGGTGVWAKAQAANGGNSPTIQEGASVIGSGGSVNTGTGAITIDPGKSQCEATQISVQELNNLSHKSDFSKISSDCSAGTRSRDEFIRANEELEYDGVKNVLTAFNACKEKWGCAATATSLHDWAKNAKDFNDYFANYLGQSHKDYYGRTWDAQCKAAWEKSHPPPSPAPAPGVFPPSPPPPTPNPSSANDDSGNDTNGDD